jgi:hypothetical protein
VEARYQRWCRAYDTSACLLNPIENSRWIVVAERQARTSRERSFDAFHDDGGRGAPHDPTASERFEQVAEPFAFSRVPSERCTEIVAQGSTRIGRRCTEDLNRLALS